MSQKFAAYDAQGNIIAFYDSVDSPVPASVTRVIEITDAQWQECLSTPGHTVVGGALVAPTPPTAAQILATAQAAQIDLLNAACQAQIVAGFNSSALGASHTYPAQMTDQQNLSASVLASLLPNLPAGWTTPFWCADGGGSWSYANHTAAQIQQVGQDGKAAILACLTKKAQLAAQVEAATTVAAVQAVVWA
jgi:hypothetical protein